MAATPRLTAARIGVFTGALAFGLALDVAAQPPVASTFFQQNCAACHTIGGGPLVGPDLKGVSDRRDRAWIIRFIEDPQAVIDAGDPTATSLVAAAGGLVMPKVGGMTPQIAESLADLLANPGGQASALAGPQVTTRAFGPADVQHGQELFNGTAALEKGGPACLSCHQAGRAGVFGGGQLGPDLTQVFERLKGRQGLGTWLSAPATPTMRSLFGAKPLTPAEIEALLAYFEDAAKQPAPASGPSLTFVVTGVIGAVVGLYLAGWAWRGRFRSVRRRLVQAATSGGTR